MKRFFVSLSLVTLLGLSAFGQESGDKVFVIADQAPLKSGADVRAQIERGTILLVRDVNDVWLKVRFQGTTGWIYSPQVIRVSEAIEYLSRRIQSRPRTEDFLLRARVWNAQGGYRTAIDDCNTAIRLRTNYALAFAERGWSYFCLSEHEKAVGDLSQAIRLNPRDDGSYNNRGLAWQSLGNREKALEDFNNAIRMNNNEPVRYVNRGILLSNYGSHESALLDFNKALKLDPADVIALVERAHVLQLKGGLSDAMDDLNEALRLDPKRAATLLKRAEVWLKNNNAEKALEDIDAAIAIDPGHTDAGVARAIVLRQTGDFDKALAQYQDLVARQPTDDYILSSFAWFRSVCPDEKFRDGSEAVQHATKACELTEWKSVSNLDILATAYAETGDFVKAIETQEKAIELLGKDEDKEISARLALFKSNKPYREQPGG